MGVKKRMITAIAVILSMSGVAQEDLLWYFGNGQAGLTFDKDGNPPTVTNDADFVIYESISTVSDCNGNLAFYTDGTKVYDSSHNLMLNGSGLLGPQENNTNPQSGSSPNGVLIVGDPSDTSKYYIFTVGETISNSVNGWRYHTVDLSQPGNGTSSAPLGEVTSKNNIIYGPVAEAQSAVSNECGDSLWIVAHSFGSDTLFALPITEAGGIGSIVKTKIGPVLGSGNGHRGSSDFNPQGDKYAMAYLWSATAGGGYVMDFDFASGTFSNSVQMPGTGQGAYGVEFSFDGLSVYLSRWSFGKIEHYNIATGIVTPVYTGPANVIIGELERAPDGKIYVGKDKGVNYLGVINNPDVATGALSNYVDQGVNMGVSVDIGLPQMLLKPGKNLWKAKISSPFGLTDVCDKGGALQLTATPDCGAWTGGAYVDSDGLFDPSGLVTPGAYEVYYSLNNCVVPDTIEFTVEDCCPPLGVRDSSFCEGESAFNVTTLVDSGIGIWSLTSSPTGTGSVATLSDSIFDPSDYVKGSTYVTDGNYELTYTYWNAPLVGCPDSAVATLEVDSFPRDIFNGLNSSLIQECALSYDIVAKNNLEYNWSLPAVSTTNTATVTSNDTYVLTVNSPSETCFTSDSIEVELDQKPTAEIEQNDTLVCGAGSIVVNVDQAGLDYLWTPGSETSQSITIVNPGKYYVTIRSSANGFCPAEDSIEVTLAPPLNINFLNLGTDVIACPKLDTVVVAVLDDPNNDTYTWSMGTGISDTSVAIYDFNEGDIVELVVEDIYGCSGSDELTLKVFCDVKDPTIPNIFTDNTDGINDLFTPIEFPPTLEGTYNTLYPESNMKIYDRWGLLMYEDSDYPSWDGKNKFNRPCSPGVYFWVLVYTDINGKSNSLNGFVHLAR